MRLAFSLAALTDFKTPAAGTKALPKKSDLSVFDQWLIYKLAQTEKTVEEAIGARSICRRGQCFV